MLGVLEGALCRIVFVCIAAQAENETHTVTHTTEYRDEGALKLVCTCSHFKIADVAVAHSSTVVLWDPVGKRTVQEVALPKAPKDVRLTALEHTPDLLLVSRSDGSVLSQPLPLLECVNTRPEGRGAALSSHNPSTTE